MSRFDTIDVRDYTEMYDRLLERIAETIAGTQETPNRPLPSILIVTKRQHKMLRRYPQVKNMYGSDQKYLLTSLNVMEMVVK